MCIWFNFVHINKPILLTANKSEITYIKANMKYESTFRNFQTLRRLVSIVLEVKIVKREFSIYESLYVQLRLPREFFYKLFQVFK